MEEIEKQIESTLDKIRPFLQRDGGDLEFVAFKDGVVYVKMLGACANCLSLDVTIKEGIQIILVEEVPGVTEVQVVPYAD
jgi:Fe-S cluster biogenesis protein NfuA